MQYSTHGKPEASEGRFEMQGSFNRYIQVQSVLEYHLQEGFKIKDIESMLSVSESTVYLSVLGFSDICDDKLDRY